MKDRIMTLHPEGKQGVKISRRQLVLQATHGSRKEGLK
jgi:hypothetical protein